MGCASHRKKQTREFADQKWGYINLQDFKARGCAPGFAYTYLWFMLIISVAVYAVDTFTAVNLLAFNKWSSKIEPAIPLEVSKWIFSVCILLSFVNLAFEGVRAIRVMRRGLVAECFMDSLAARWESIRFGSGQGWRRFLVFAELAKSKKGSEYVALFTYFSFQSWIRVIFCSGPRQVVNALTLRSVYVARLTPQASSVDGAILGFFDKIKLLAAEDYQQAMILSSMLFTLIIWVFSALFLLTAVLFYVFFLFHWIPRADGGLTGYCDRKINKKLLRVVTKKVNTALAKGEADRWKAELKVAKKNGEKTPHLDRAATIPKFPYAHDSTDDSLLQMPSIGRDERSRPSTPGSIEMGSINGSRRPMQRTVTDGSTSSMSSNAPLVPSAANMGYGRSQSPAYSMRDDDLLPAPYRPGTANSQRSLSSNSRNGFGSPYQNARNITASPALMERGAPPHQASTRRPMDSPTSPAAMGRSNTGTTTYSVLNPYATNSAPSPTTRTYGGLPPPSRAATGPAGPNQQPQGSQRYGPQRNVTAPQYTSGGDSYGRSGPPQGTRGTPYGYDNDSQRANRGYYGR